MTLSAYDNLNRLTSQAPGGPMVIMGALNEPGTVTISGVPVTVDANNNFRGTVPTTTGTNYVHDRGEGCEREHDDATV